jgi:hypothetical protein
MTQRAGDLRFLRTVGDRWRPLMPLLDHCGTDPARTGGVDPRRLGASTLGFLRDQGPDRPAGQSAGVRKADIRLKLPHGGAAFPHHSFRTRLSLHKLIPFCHTTKAMNAANSVPNKKSTVVSPRTSGGTNTWRSGNIASSAAASSNEKGFAKEGPVRGFYGD